MERHYIKRVFIILFILAASGLFGCEFLYTLKDSKGVEIRITPGSVTSLSTGERYVLSVSYREDHNRCLVAPADTLFLVEEERWRAGKEYLPLVLESAPGWTSTGRSHSTSFIFFADKTGTWEMEVLRECTRGGYKASLFFQVG